jgi:hypothetical protein
MDDCRAKPNTWFAPSLRPFVFFHLLKYFRSVKLPPFSSIPPRKESAIDFRQMTIFDHIERCVIGLRDVACNKQDIRKDIVNALGWISELEIEMQQRAARPAVPSASSYSHPIAGSFQHVDSGFVGMSNIAQTGLERTGIQTY